MKIRKATENDAERLCEVLIRSVREVCGPDYDNDEKVLDYWCSNKTPENLRNWVKNPENYFIVAVNKAEKIVGAGMIKHTGHIHICYLLPEALGKGIGQMILDDMIDFVRKNGVTTVTLGSTITAKKFYEKNEFRVISEQLDAKIPQIEMAKKLSPPYFFKRFNITFQPIPTNLLTN